MMPSVSIVITSRDKPDYLSRTLASLACQTLAPNEIVVVDDASDPPLYPPPEVTRLCRRDAPANRAAARNLGIRLASCPLIVLMDDDCLVREDWLLRHVRRHELGPGCLVAGPVRRILSDDDGAFWEAPVPPGATQHRTFECTLGLLRENAAPWNVAPCATNVSVFRETILHAGGYDEGYRGWGVEDVDLSFRLISSGVPLVIDSAPVVYHAEHHRCRPAEAEEELRNLWRFASRHGFWAYGPPPAEWGGPRRYPQGGAWFRARAMTDPPGPTAIRIDRVNEPPSGLLPAEGALEWILGAPPSGCERRP